MPKHDFQVGDRVLAYGIVPDEPMLYIRDHHGRWGVVVERHPGISACGGLRVVPVQFSDTGEYYELHYTWLQPSLPMLAYAHE
jgi:hypothetical protein